MIESESERIAAVKWLSYWNTTVSTGAQSWLAGEQARVEIMQLRQSVAEYDRRSSRLVNR